MEDIKRIKVVDVKKIGREGERIFAELLPRLEKEHFGEFIAAVPLGLELAGRRGYYY